MANDGRDMCIQRKRSRDDMDIYEEEAMRFFPMLVGFFVMLVGICSHRKYLVKEPSKVKLKRRFFARDFGWDLSLMKLLAKNSYV
jgi:hypothetical protein